MKRLWLLIGMVFLFTYAANSFVLWDLNPSNWKMGSRLFLILINSFLFILIVGVYDKVDEGDDDYYPKKNN